MRVFSKRREHGAPRSFWQYLREILPIYIYTVGCLTLLVALSQVLSPT